MAAGWGQRYSGIARLVRWWQIGVPCIGYAKPRAVGLFSEDYENLAGIANRCDPRWGRRDAVRSAHKGDGTCSLKVDETEVEACNRRELLQPAPNRVAPFNGRLVGRHAYCIDAVPSRQGVPVPRRDEPGVLNCERTEDGLILIRQACWERWSRIAGRKNEGRVQLQKRGKSEPHRPSYGRARSSSWNGG